MSDTPSVMVIGGGGAGRLMAQGLKKRGIPCVVFEKDASLEARKRDWDYGVHWATSLLEVLLPEHITMEKVLSAQVDHLPVTPDSKMKTFNGATGEVITVLPIPNMMRLRRREFCRVIGEGLDIRYGKRLASVEANDEDGTVTATFEDGSKHTADFLIGTDGARSVVRSYLLGDVKAKSTETPVAMTLARGRLPQAQVDMHLKLGERMWIAFHPEGGYILLCVHDAYDKPDPSTWVFALTMAWQNTTPQRGPPVPSEGVGLIRDIKKVAETYAEPFRSIVLAMSEDDDTAWAGYPAFWPTEPWPEHPARGRVTLVGDSLHALLPQRGQGMNNAILDCVEFFKELDAAPGIDLLSFSEAVKQYEEVAWVRGREAVDESLTNALAITSWDTLQTSPLWKLGIAQKASHAQ